MTAVVHWDDLRTRDRVHTDIAATWTDLGSGAGSLDIGLQRLLLHPGKRSTPVHVHGAEEEIFFVLAGSGMLWQNGRTCEVGPGDCIVHLPNRERHTLRAGDDGLEVLAFGTRVPIELCYLPRAEHSWAGPTVLPSPGRIDLFPMDDAAEPLEFPPPGERPPNVVAAGGVPDRRPRDGRVRRDLGTAAGSQRTGLHHVAVGAGPADGAAPLPLGRGGAVRRARGRGPPAAGRRGARGAPRAASCHARRGRPSRTPSGAAMAASSCWPTARADPDDVCYYPRSNKIYWPGLGVVGRIEHVDFWEGEEL